MKLSAKCNRCSEEEYNPSSPDYLNRMKTWANEKRVIAASTIVVFPDLSWIDSRFEISGNVISSVDTSEMKNLFEKYFYETSRQLIEYDKLEEYLTKNRGYRWLRQ